MKLARVLSILVVLGAPTSAGCSSPPTSTLRVSSQPEGASVYLSRRGERVYSGGFGPVMGNVSAEPIVEGFALVGTSPMKHRSPLVEEEADASLLGVGVTVERRYTTGVLRIEKEGFVPEERIVRLVEGDVRVEVELQPRTRRATPTRRRVRTTSRR